MPRPATRCSDLLVRHVRQLRNAFRKVSKGQVLYGAFLFYADSQSPVWESNSRFILAVKRGRLNFK